MATVQKTVSPETLVRMGWISEGKLEELREQARQANYDDVMLYLSQTKAMTSLQMNQVWAYENGVQYHDLATSPPEEDVVELVPPQVARQYRAVPVRRDPKDPTLLHLACEDPTDIDVERGLRGALPRWSLVLHYCRSQDISNTISQIYSADAEASAVAKNMMRQEGQGTRRSGRGVGIGGDLGLLIGNGDEEDAARVVNLIIEQGVRVGASDIHLDPQRESTLVRYRLDGVLYDASRYATELAGQLVNRIKVMGGMNVSENRIPLDGRITTKVEGREIDLRVATTPARGTGTEAEKVVMRILNADASTLRLEPLGYSGAALDALRDAFNRSKGMVIFTGPTGSGKSTSIFAMLNEIATREVNVLTVEDPIEYRLEGVTQVSVDVKAGRTFPIMLRAFLRLDPDVVLVGEMRDEETARIAVQAAQTGHLVLSTLHTNTAAEAVERLVQMGVPHYLLGSVINAVVAQRLLRLLCEHCKVKQDPTELQLRRFVSAGLIEAGDVASLSGLFYGPKGCGRCKDTGYNGRVAVTEVLSMSDKIARLLHDKAPAMDIDDAAQAEGMTPLLHDGWARALKGKTSLDEVLLRT